MGYRKLPNDWPVRLLVNKDGPADTQGNEGYLPSLEVPNTVYWTTLQSNMLLRICIYICSKMIIFADQHNRLGRYGPSYSVVGGMAKSDNARHS